MRSSTKPYFGCRNYFLHLVASHITVRLGASGQYHLRTFEGGPDGSTVATAGVILRIPFYINKHFNTNPALLIA